MLLYVNVYGLVNHCRQTNSRTALAAALPDATDETIDGLMDGSLDLSLEPDGFAEITPHEETNLCSAGD